MLLAAFETNAVRSELCDRIGLHVGEGHVVSVVDLVIVVSAKRALGVKVLRRQFLCDLGVLHDLLDLALDEVSGRIIGHLAGRNIAKGAKHEIETTAALPGGFEDPLPFLGRGGFGGFGAFFEAEGHNRILHLIPDTIVVCLLLCDGSIVLRGVPNRHDILCRALKNSQVFCNWCRCSDNLNTRRAGADNAHAFVAQVHSLGPGTCV